MPAKDQKVTHRDDKIVISRPCFQGIALVSYDDDLFKKVSSTTWSVSKSKTGKEYLTSKNYGLLHQLVIKHFYGEDVLQEAYERGFVIDHLDNNGRNCTNENLTLIPKLENTAKGLTYDTDRSKTPRHFIVNITKDMDTQEYQIAVILNIPYCIFEDGKEILISRIHFRYGTDFKTAFIDANSIINDLKTKQRCYFEKLRYRGFCYLKPELGFGTVEDLENGFIWRNGRLYHILGSPNTTLVGVQHRKELHK